MALSDKIVVKQTPDITDLLPTREHKCKHCTCVFNNHSHYLLHLRKRHKITISNKAIESHVTTFHCPIDGCPYNAQNSSGRSFTSLRSVRQHYQKVHMEKKYKCQECGQKFLQLHHLEAHKCEHACPICELTYNSKAALRTHMRRKNHIVEETDEGLSTKVPIPRAKPNQLTKTLSTAVKSTQAEEPTCIYLSPVLQLLTQPNDTDQIFYCLPAIEIPNDSQEEIQPEETLVSINNNLAQFEVEEQNALDNSGYQNEASNVIEETPAVQTAETGNDNEMPNFTVEDVERLLRDMETQTDEVDFDAIDIDMNTEVLAPLLRDIQTQTLDTKHLQSQGTMTEDLDSDANNYESFEEPIFGTQTSAHMQTQTCDDFFEELALSHIQTQTNWPDSLYNTQCTQTCDEMLDEILELENLQSTCTQTRWLDWQEADDTRN